MYGWDTLVLLKHYLESGLSKTAIARQLGVSRRAIYHWIQTGQLDRELRGPHPPAAGAGADRPLRDGARPPLWRVPRLAPAAPRPARRNWIAFSR